MRKAAAMKKLSYLRKMLKEALSFYTYLLHSSRKWSYKSKKGSYPQGYDPAKHGKTAVTADARAFAIYWLYKFKAERARVQK